MTGPEHYKRAEELLVAADEWLNADTGWKARLTAEERLDRRAQDIQAAAVHARLADVAVAAVGAPDRSSWMNAVFTKEGSS